MKYELTENEIKQATNEGAKRWTKGNRDRLYLNCKYLGGGYEWKKNGYRGRGWLPIDGEEWLSNKRTGVIDSTYIDLKTGELVGETAWKEYVELVDKTIAETKKTAAKRAEKEAEEKARLDSIIAPTMPQIEETAKLVSKTPEQVIALCKKAQQSPEGAKMKWDEIVSECLIQARIWAKQWNEL